jgi:site-specific recombinase XerD
MSTNDPNRLEPSEALWMYVESRKNEVRESTVKSIRSRVGMFVEFCEENDIESLSELDGMDLHRYRVEIGDGVSKSTLISRLSDLRVFLRWCESVEAIKSGTAEKIELPEDDSRRTEVLEPDHADRILEYLRRFEYASRDHVVIRLLWATGMRMGAIRSIDVDDYDSEDQCIYLSHRPETETPLKNGDQGERPVGLTDETAVIIEDYLDHNRTDRTDDYGRSPLVSTRHGRIGKATLRRTVYRLTRPCTIGEACPYGKEPSDCEAAQYDDKASQCPDTVSPHDVRRGAITHLLKNDMPKPMVSDRCDVSPDILDKHYDQRSDLEKMEQRRAYLDNI